CSTARMYLNVTSHQNRQKRASLRYRSPTPKLRVEHGPVAQWIEQQPSKLLVGSPNLPGVAAQRFISVYHADGLPRPSSTRTTSNLSVNIARTSSAVNPVAGPPGANA